MEKTISMAMPAVPEPLTVKDVVTKLIEENLQAWRALPQSVRTALIENPGAFQFGQLSLKDGSFSLTITYKGVSLRYNHTAVAWVINDISLS